MHKAYVTKYIRLNKGAKYALYLDDQPLETHTFPVHKSASTDAVFIGIINAMMAAIKAGAEELFVYLSNEQVIWSIEHPHAVRSAQTISYLMNIDRMREQLTTTFIPCDYEVINRQVMEARRILKDTPEL